MCLNHLVTNSSNLAYSSLLQIIDIRWDSSSGQYAVSNKYGSSDTQTDMNQTVAAELTYAMYLMYNSSGTNKTTDQNRLVGQLFKMYSSYIDSNAYVRVDNNAEGYSDNYADNITSATQSMYNQCVSHATTVAGYSSISAAWSSSDIYTISGDDVILGGIDLSLGSSQQITGITVTIDGSEYSGTVKWSSDGSSNWKTISSSNYISSSNSTVWIKISASAFSNSNTTASITITFKTASFYTYHSTMFMFAYNRSSVGQQVGYVVSERETSYISASVSQTITLTIPIDIEVTKADVNNSSQSIEDIGFYIYYISGSTTYYLTTSGTWSTTKTIHYTNSDGKISFSNVQIDPDTTVYVQECATGNLYYRNEGTTKSYTYTSSNSSHTYPFTDTPISLTIYKYTTYKSSDSGEDHDAMESVSFYLYYVDGKKWVQGTGTYDLKSYGSTPTAYSTGSNGSVTIYGLKAGTYYIYEASINWSKNTGFYLEDQDSSDGDPSITGTENYVYCGSQTLTNTGSSSEFTYTCYNKKSGSLTIKKTGHYAPSSESNNSESIDASFALLFWDGTNYYWVSGNNGESYIKTYTLATKTNYSSAATSYSTDSGKVTIYNLRIGTYYIFETAILTDGYYLEDQVAEDGAPDVSVDEDWVYKGSKSVSQNTNSSVSYINYTGWLDINKYDKYTEDLLEGVSFALLYYDGTNYYWVNGDAGSAKQYIKATESNVSKATQYTTDSEGNISICYLKFGTYYIYETAIDWDVTGPYYLADQPDASGRPDDPSEGMTEWKYRGTITLESETAPSVTCSIWNYISGNLEITKTDLDAEEYLGETYYISNTGFKLLYVKDRDGNKVYDADGNLGIWVTGDIGEMKTYDTSTTTDKATEYFTNSTGKVTVDSLRLGTYYIFESTSNELLGYYLSDQTTSNGLSYTYYKTKGTREYNAVLCETVVIHSSNYDADDCSTHDSHNPTKVEIQNVRRVKLCGYVWVDESTNKSTTGDGGYNSLYDVGSEDIVQNVTVMVKYKSDNKVKVKATSYTEESRIILL